MIEPCCLMNLNVPPTRRTRREADHSSRVVLGRSRVRPKSLSTPHRFAARVASDPSVSGAPLLSTEPTSFLDGCLDKATNSIEVLTARASRKTIKSVCSNQGRT
jgi:hypothetical protein